MKSKLIILLFITILLNGCANYETITGYWTGSMEMNGKTIDMSIDLNSESKVFSSYDLMLIEQDISNLTIKDGNISFSIVLDVEVVFNGKISDNQITGTTTINGGPPNMNIVFTLTKHDEKPVKPYSIESLSVNSNNVTLSAEIYKPKTGGLHPAIVLLHGSSANLKSDCYFDADYFAKRGFEVLIFDKRGNGKSTGDYYLSNYDDLIADAIACLEELYSRESVDKNKIGLWGFSQGAMLLPKLVSKTNIPKFLIVKSPEVISVAEAAAFSDSLRVVNSGNSDLDGQTTAISHRRVEKMIREGKNSDEVELFIHQNAQNNHFMNQTGLYGNITIDKNEYNGFYWQGRTENFISYWENINIPTLVLLGERDQFVNAIRNEAILQSLGNPNIETKLFPLANHNLKKSFNPTTDSEFDWPRIIEGYSDTVDKWIEREITNR